MHGQGQETGWGGAAVSKEVDGVDRVDGGGLPTGVEEQLVREAIRLRMVAIYHSCMSSAAFKREDAIRCRDEHEATACRREACGYEAAAGWINAALKDIPKANISA